ncbi:hypothetical protein S245_060286, partial [Arachis hypogaea]
CFGFGCGDFGWLGGCCCCGGIEMKIGCCCNEKKSYSIFGFDCSHVHYPSTLDFDYYHESSYFGLEKDRED